MSKDWQLLELQEVSKVVDSLHRTPAFTNSGYPMVRAADVKGGFLDLTRTQLVSEEEFLDFTRNHKPQQGDIVVSRVGSYFNFSYNKNDEVFCIGQNTSIIAPNIDSRFLYYSLISPFVQQQVERSLVGTSQKTLSLKHIRELKIPTPSLNEQHAVAEILGTLDDKIELNRHMNQTLESMARSVFRQWFVESEEVMDWDIGRLGDFINVNERAITKTYSYDEIEYIDISSVSVGHLEGTTAYALKDSPSRAKRLVRHGDTIWSTVRPNRKSYLFISNPKENLVVSTGFAVLTPKKIPASFLYFHTTTGQFVDYLVSNADGSAYPAVLPERFADTEFPIPPKNVLDSFERIASPMLDKIAHNEKESRTLASLRDSLLPKLMRGEVRVQDVEKQ